MAAVKSGECMRSLLICELVPSTRVRLGPAAVTHHTRLDEEAMRGVETLQRWEACELRGKQKPKKKGHRSADKPRTRPSHIAYELDA